MFDKSAVKIMVVDDEPFILKLHARTLVNLGFTATSTCEGAVRAMETIALSASPPDLIVLDLNMPDMDGVEFVRYLVQRNYSGSLILLSGEDERVLQAAEKLVRAHQITMLGHLRKPATPAMLGALLETWKPPALAQHWTPAAPDKTAAGKKTYTADEVRAAITDGELANYYQPKVSLSTGHVVGVEALVRWQHPLDGLVFPDQFIGVAEAHELIHPLTCTVITGALADIRSLRQQSGLALQVAINVSMDDLVSLDFADYIAQEAAVAGVLAKDVTLEVTESRLMQDIRVPLEVLTRLRLKRFRLSIDDFGTGHSSLAQVRDLPFTELKIDRSFVHACADGTVRAIVDASVMLAKQLNMSIVAEGVEDRADWDFARRSGCDVAQGYFIAKPMPAADLHDWIEVWEERALAVA